MLCLLNLSKFVEAGTGSQEGSQTYRLSKLPNSMSKRGNVWYILGKNWLKKPDSSIY